MTLKAANMQSESAGAYLLQGSCLWRYLAAGLGVPSAHEPLCRSVHSSASPPLSDIPSLLALLLGLQLTATSTSLTLMQCILHAHVYMHLKSAELWDKWRNTAVLHVLMTTSIL